MYYRIAYKNLMSQKLRTVLTLIGLIVGIASLLVFTGLSAGLQQAIYSNILNTGPLTELTVSAKSQQNSLFSLLPTANTKSQITPDELAQIEKIPHVSKVYPEMNYSNVSSLQISLVGQTFQTDSMIFGVPEEYIQDTLKTPDQIAQWNNAVQNYPAQPYPAILSSRVIDLYNFTIAQTSKLPHLSENDLMGLNLTLLPDESTFFNNIGNQNVQPVNAKLIGFSDKTSLVGVTLPIDVVRKLNQKLNPNYTDSYLDLYVEVDSADNTDQVQQAIDNMGLTTTSAEQQIKTFQQNFKFVNFGLSLISLVILIVAGLMIANTFFSAISERKTEIGVFRALGATRQHIQKIFLAEASLLGAIGGVIGIIVGLIGEFVINFLFQRMLPDITSKPASIFAHDIFSFIWIFLFSIVLSIIFAFIPATRAARMEPLEALNE